MIQISAEGVRNEFWRRRLLCGLMVPERYATLLVSEEVEQHPLGVEALARLLTGPYPHDPLLNRTGDCDWHAVEIDGVTFDLFISCFAQGERYRRGSDDPSDDDMTTRVFSCLLRSEHTERTDQAG